jgi:hypothetical protein
MQSCQSGDLTEEEFAAVVQLRATQPLRFAPAALSAGFGPHCRRSWERDGTAEVDPTATLAAWVRGVSYLIRTADLERSGANTRQFLTQSHLSG